MEEINLKELFAYFKARIVLILIMVLFVVLFGSVYSLFLKVPVYESTSSIVLVSDEGQASGNVSGSYSQTDAQLNKNLVSTYCEIVKSKRIAELVIKNLSLNYSVDELLGEIKVTNSDNTEIIKVKVIDKDRGLAADIANEIVKVFSEEIKSIYKLQNVSVVDVAEEADKSYNMNYMKEFVIYVLAGIVLACAIIFIVYYFDTTIKSTDEIENGLGIPVFGVVPEVKRKQKGRK